MILPCRPSGYETNNRDGQVLFAHARASRGRHERQAIVSYSDLLEKDRNHRLALTNRGLAHSALGQARPPTPPAAAAAASVRARAQPHRLSGRRAFWKMPRLCSRTQGRPEGCTDSGQRAAMRAAQAQALARLTQHLLRCLRCASSGNWCSLPKAVCARVPQDTAAMLDLTSSLAAPGKPNPANRLRCLYNRGATPRPTPHTPSSAPRLAVRLAPRRHACIFL